MDKGMRNCHFFAIGLLLLCHSILSDAQSCTHGDVRLVTSGIRYNWYNYGTVQVCSLGQWGNVCGRYSSNFGPSEARVICRQLGYSDRGASYRGNSYYGSYSAPVLLPRGLNCIGTETSWLDCDLQSSSSYNCGSSYYHNAGVQCTYAPYLQVSIRATPPVKYGVVYAGSSLTLECIVSPYTTGIETYRWSSNCKGDCFVHGNTKTVHREVLRSDDSGSHTCIVQRRTTSRSTSITFRVVEPEVSTTISPPFVGLDSPPYEHFTLWCNATSPEPLHVPTIITWYKDGVVISESESMIIQTMPNCQDDDTNPGSGSGDDGSRTSKNCSVLIVNDALTSFSGEYMCIATIMVPGLDIVSSNVTTNVRINKTTEQIIQLHLAGVHHCKDWVFIEARQKVADIDKLLSQAIEENCNCDFSVDRLLDSGLVCTEDLNEVVYQARVLATPFADSNTIVNLVSQIVNTDLYGKTFVVQGLRLIAMPKCSVTSDSFRDMECTESNAYVSAVSTNLSSVIAITEGIVIILFIVIAVSSCVVCVVRYKKSRKSGHFTRLSDQSDVSYEREAGVSISGGHHSRPITATLNRTVDDVYEELPLKADQDDNYYEEK